MQLAYTEIDESTAAVFMGAIFGTKRIVAVSGAAGETDGLLVRMAGVFVGVGAPTAADGVFVVELLTRDEVAADW